LHPCESIPGGHTARCSGTVLFNDRPQSGELMKHSPVTITPPQRIHG